MSFIASALQSISTHRDVVPLNHVRSTGQWTITGFNRTNGAAVVTGEDGQIVRACPSKRAAFAAVASN